MPKHTTLCFLEGEPTEVAGYELTFLGKEQIEKHFADREKYKYSVKIAGNGEDRVVSAILYWSDYNQRTDPFLEPGIRWGALNDLYVTPKATEDEDVWYSQTIMRSSTFDDPITPNTKVTLERFTMPMELGPAADGRMRMSAVLQVDNGEGEPEEVKAITLIGGGGPSGPTFDPIWTELPGTNTAVALTKITRNNEDPSKSTGQFAFRDVTKPMPSPREIFTVDFSVKPLISLVWIGVITMVLGFTFSIVRYTRQLKKTPKAATAQQTSA